MTHPILLFSLAILAAPIHAPAVALPRVAHDPPPQLMTNIMALLNASREFGIDPNFAFAVTWQESRMNERAIGRYRLEDGSWGPILAHGLMQNSVQYQDELVRRFLPGLNPKNYQWYNPVHSARLGCAMLAYYLPRYGKWGTLACYNAGEFRYKQLWHGRRLPQETIDYQNKIL